MDHNSALSRFDAVKSFTVDQLALLVQAVGGLEAAQKILRGEMTVSLSANHILQCSAPFNTTTFIDKNWSVWRGPANGDGLQGEIDQDERSLDLQDVDWRNVDFIHCINLDGDEKSISGEEKLRRLKERGHIRFGGNVLQSLWTNYKDNPSSSVLEWLHRKHNITFLDFFGLILRSPQGKRSVIYLYCEDGEWKWSFWGSLEDLPWEAHNTSPVLKQQGY